GCVQALGIRASDEHTAHENQPTHAARVLNRQRQGQATTERITHQVNLLQPQFVHYSDGMGYPAFTVINLVFRAFAVSKTQHVRGNHPSSFGKLRNHQAPVSPRGYTWA